LRKSLSHLGDKLRGKGGSVGPCSVGGRGEDAEAQPAEGGAEEKLRLSEISKGTLNGKRGKGPERDTALREGKALKGEPQEGYRHETRPGGFGRSKPLGG